MASAGVRVDALRTQELADRVGGLSAPGEPAADLLLVDLHRRRVGLRVVVPEDLVRQLVSKPEAVSVEQFSEDDGTVVLELRVAEDDAGKVIGRGGRTVAALRTVMKAVAVRHDCRVLVDVVD